MNTDSLPDLGFDWAEALTMVQTTGVDFGINLVTAIVIFFLGKWVVNLVVKGLTKAMQKGELDVTLSRFIGNLARMLRKKLHKLGVHEGFAAVYSPEVVDKELILRGSEESNKASSVGTMSYMPAAFGIVCASVVIRDLAGIASSR